MSVAVPPLVPVPEAAQKAGVSPWTIRKEINEGRLRAQRIGGGLAASTKTWPGGCGVRMSRRRGDRRSGRPTPATCDLTSAGPR